MPERPRSLLSRVGNLGEATLAVRQKELLVCLKAERRMQKYF